jgi:hypothetical protein
MELMVQIPDDIAEGLSTVGGDLGRLNKPDLRRLLGFETSDQIDTFLKAHDVWIDFTMEDLERNAQGWRQGVAPRSDTRAFLRHPCVSLHSCLSILPLQPMTR